MANSYYNLALETLTFVELLQNKAHQLPQWRFPRQYNVDIAMESTNELNPLPAAQTSKSTSPLLMPFSYGQPSCWLLDDLVNQQRRDYNVAFALQSRAQFDICVLGQVLTTLTERHASLRTTHSVDAQSGKSVPVVNDALPFDFQYLNAVNWQPEEYQQYLKQEMERGFDLANGPVLRTRLISRSADEQILLMVVDHTAADFWLLLIMMDEFIKLYAGLECGQLFQLV
jgi:hypothetical protein